MNHEEFEGQSQLGRGAGMADEGGESMERAEELNLGDQVRRAPYASLGAAMGVGFIIGGGLASRAGLQMLGVVARAFLVPVVVRMVTEAIAPELQGELVEDESGGPQ